MKKMSSLFATCVSALAIVFPVASNATGLDGVSFTTNDWFDASFTSLAVDTVIATNTTTGITRGAGSWTAAPTNGTAKIVADGEGPATYLEVKAPGESLTFTPSALGSPTGFETVSAEMRATVMDELPELFGAQAAFMVYDDETSVKPCGYTDAGWTNLVYSGAMADLTNGWFTIYMDFASISGTRCVRYSVMPSGGSPSVLADSAGETWFPTAGSATTVNAVSLSGTGDCRTINGDSLAEVMVAEVGGVQYSTVNAAIAAANAGDTVSLVRALDGADVAVSKNVTLALGPYNLVAAGFSVASGVTLTVTGTGEISTPSITGGGSLAFANAATLNLKGGSSVLAAITAAGDLTVTGCGDIALAGAATVAGTLTFTPDMVYTVYESYRTFFNNGYTLKLTADSVSAAVLNGGATIVADVSASAGTFYGKITGDITAGGSLVLQGPQTVVSSLAVSSGMVTVGSREPAGCDLRLDASDTSNMTVSEGSLTAFTTKNGNGTRSWNSTGTAYVTVGTDENYFDGRQVMIFNANAEYSYPSGNLRYGALFAVYQTNIGSLSGDNENVLFTSRNNEGNDKIRFGIYKSGYQNRSKWYGWNNSNSQSSNYTWPIFLDGSNTSTSYTSGKKSVLSFASSHPGPSSRGLQIGCDAVTFVGAVAEMVGMNNPISLEERAAIESYLMQKWDCTDRASFVQFASTAEVALSSDATLNLGGLAQSIQSLSGSGVVSNGTLTVTDPISVSAGSTLVMPLGSTFTCAAGTGTNVNTTAGTVTILHSAADIDGVVYETVQDAFDAYESGTLTIYENATGVDLGTTEKSVTIVLADGVSAPTFVTTLPWQTTYSEGALTHARVASTFVYIGPATYAEVASNFEIGGIAASDVPGESDTVQFDMATSIYIDSTDISYAAMVLNADVTVTGAASKYLRVTSYTGTGKLVLGEGGWLAPLSTADSTINCPLEVTGSNARLYIVDGHKTTVKGKMTGSGTLNMPMWANSGYYGNVFDCDGSDFEGTINEQQPYKANAKRNTTQFKNVDFSKATVNLTQGATGYGTSALAFQFSNKNSVIKFGSLNGYVNTANTGALKDHATIEVGNLGNNDVVEGNWMPDDGRNPYIRKVGNGTLTTTATNAYGYILNGGTLRVLATDATTVRTEVKGVSIVSRTETVDAVEYRVYSLAQRGPMVILF